ncbi:MAG: DoxX family protein, partial [Bacteroidales bacterium]|nr:DoxX family protein [Bacteroidales bacterium]
MTILRALSRFVVGIVFILSGFLKAIDPVGGALKVGEYLKAFHLEALDFASLPAAVILAFAEFI